ncbi:hypothetical protein AJ78_03315 [Emergomyces pasteurianus Ep9510]|uniref:Uncharacterized protein n=1 Tax=Emergomyces pasteurianus Ep9510 TaxID=1447872 RepID=A0A1J9PKZ2_9EURO|nr:hypothetical protein AJ78_03315 [Emergomyces pasteurianus Ep9510]
MVELTIGYVSGIIAAGIFLLQHFIPTASSLILSGLVRDENTAATWTQIARSLHSTYWPTFVGADSVASGPVSRTVQLEALIRPLTLGVVAIAAIVTPLGLYDAIVPSQSTSLRPFQYTQDKSSFGFGTTPRSNLGFNRFCGNLGRTTCPGSDVVIENYPNGTQYLPYGYDARIPPKTMDTFQSGLKSLPPTVSSLFDIEWRTYGIRTEDDVNNGSRYLVGNYRQAGVLALNDAYDIVEGLIVDTKNGGIGFRNHTTPSPLPHGSEWSEDLLFVEPHTMCIDTNLTIDLRIPPSGTTQFENIVLTDRGGFVNLNTSYPTYDRMDSQTDPDFFGRAYKAAYLNNALTMIYLNVSNPRTKDLEPFSYMNSEINKTFPLDKSAAAYPDRFLTNRNWGTYLKLSSLFSNSTLSNSTSSDTKYPNPFDITSKNFTSIETLCQGAGGLDYANITNIGVACGMAFGAARRSDGSRSLVFEPGTDWTVPLYSCASAARAVIKTVDFRFNGTDGLRSLVVHDIREKVYANDGDKPLWGVERSEEILNEVLPLWGLVSDEYKGREDISVLQKESLWLPGFAGRIFTSPVGYSNLAGIYFHTGGFQTAYDVQTTPPNGVTDYSGSTNIAMFSKWQEWSNNANTTAKIVNAVWTDVAANAVIGTKGWISHQGRARIARRQNSPPPTENELREVPVVVFQKVIKYDLKFAIPAFLALVFALVIASTSCLLCLFGRARPSRMRRYLFYTSPGRIMASFVYPNQTDPQAPSKEWNKSVGYKRIAVDGPVPRAKDEVMMAKFGNTNTTNADAPLLKDGSMGDNPGFVSPNQPQQYAAYNK